MAGPVTVRQTPGRHSPAELSDFGPRTLKSKGQRPMVGNGPATTDDVRRLGSTRTASAVPGSLRLRVLPPEGSRVGPERGGEMVAATRYCPLRTGSSRSSPSSPATRWNRAAGKSRPPLSSRLSSSRATGTGRACGRGRAGARAPSAWVGEPHLAHRATAPEATGHARVRTALCSPAALQPWNRASFGFTGTARVLTSPRSSFTRREVDPTLCAAARRGADIRRHHRRVRILACESERGARPPVALEPNRLSFAPGTHYCR